MKMKIKKLKSSLHVFFLKYSTFSDNIILILLFLSAIIGAGLITLNHFYFKYTVASWNYWRLWNFGMLFLVFIFWGMYIRKISPRCATFLWGFGVYYWTFVVTSALTQGVQATPFLPIDEYLINADYWLGINTPVIMAWIHMHPMIHAWLTKIYFSLTWQLIAIPAILMCLNARKILGVFFIAVLISFFIGTGIYYFFPTMAPSGVFHSIYFTKQQHATSLAFYQVHHHLRITESDGGLIAFPSFHVVWAIILAYCCKAKKYIFYPLLIYNLILIAATVLLGWHYMMDVISGIALAIFGIYAGEKILAVTQSRATQPDLLYNF
ncbi:MAG: hypothetical protein ACD_29C00103G0001 [uncultured bacterium]|nr:MAG: hypothetical protein ACD_29C00103G0001 [uncultured bacterium]